MNRLRASIAIVVALLIAGGVFLWLAQPGRPLQTAGPGCAGCHIRTTLAWDGPAAAAFSKGVHALNHKHIFPDATNSDGGAARYMRAAECVSCHQSAHAAWRASAHGRAFTNPIFQHAFHRDRKAWCLNCHAPLWNQQNDGTAEDIAAHPDFDAVYAEGVNCVTCHIRNGRIHGATDYTQRPDARLFHPVQFDPGLARNQFCGSCHQFNFVHRLEPFTLYEGDEHPMQNVVRESLETNGALYPQGCVGCHYADGDHSLKSDGLRSLRDKFQVKLETTTTPGRTENQNVYTVRLSVRIPRIAHHFPTGDLFRILSFYVEDANGNELYRYDFRKEVRVVDRAVISDTTLKPRPDRPGASAIVEARVDRRPLRCRLVYRLQGAIDPEIEQDFENPGILRESVYDGPCLH